MLCFNHGPGPPARLFSKVVMPPLTDDPVRWFYPPVTGGHV